MGFVAFPLKFWEAVFSATHCKIWDLINCETLRTFVRFNPLMDAVEEAIGVLQSPEYLEREAREGQAASPDVVDLARAL